MPQATFPVMGMGIHMLYSRWHVESSHVGRIFSRQTRIPESQLGFLEFGLWYLHVPIVGAMFWASMIVPNPVNLSAAMNMYHVVDWWTSWISGCVYYFCMYP